MADVKISALPASTTPLAGTEVLPIVQSGSTVQVSVANLTAGRAVSALSLTSTTTLGVTGVSTLTGGAVIQGLTVGLGANAVANNTAVGVSALGAATLSGGNNTGAGAYALTANTSGNYNNAFGFGALAQNTTGVSNAAVGYLALYANISGGSNTSIGNNSLVASTGSTNIGIGSGAGSALTTGSNNTIIGSVAGTAGLSDTVIIAAGAAERMRIDGSGNVGIGTNSPNARLNVAYSNTNTSDYYNGVRETLQNTSATAGNFGTLSFTTAAGNDAAAIWTVFNSHTASAASGDLVFGTTNAGSVATERMRISAAGTVSIPGTLSIAAYTETIVASGTVGASATLAITAGTVLTATLTSATACTITLPPVSPAGKSFILLLKQPASGTATTATFITSPASHIMWNSSGAPTITATVGKMDILTFVSDGTNWYGSYSQGYTP